MPWKCIAWDPDDCGVEEARAYTGSTPSDIAQQHAEWLYTQGDPQEKYNVRVRASKGDIAHEWDIHVHSEIEVSFRASLVFRFPKKASLVSPGPEPKI